MGVSRGQPLWCGDWRVQICDGLDIWGVSRRHKTLVQGSCVYVGVKVSEVKGDSIVNKIRGVMTPEGVNHFIAQALLPDAGFVFVHDQEGSLVFLPPHHIVVQMGLQSNADPCTGVRWGFLHETTKKQMLQQIVGNIDASIALYPDIADQGYTDIKVAFENGLIPTASD